MSELQKLREAAGYATPEEFAPHAGVSNNTIRRAERGFLISRPSAVRIARALSKSLEEIEGLNYVGKGGPDNGRIAERLENL